MATDESTMFADALMSEVERIIAALEGVPSEKINERPPAPGANSLLVLAIHTMGNVEEAVFEILDGQPEKRDRDSEFVASEMSAADVRQRWNDLQQRARSVIEDLSDEQLDRVHEHWRWGNLSGRALLLRAATHAAEHAGHSELTRDWLMSQQ